ncbi:MAG: hypothetical protein GWP03_07235 [Proteobacteria bacterium]|nr:hypothetical protein [Pseudomonadota bacterium]
MKKLLVISVILLFFSISLNANAFSIQWTKMIGGGYPHYSTDIALDTLGQPIVTGYSSNGDDYAMFTVGLDTSGDSLWSTAFEWNNSRDEHSHGITVDNNNNVILTGYVKGAYPVFAVVKYKNNNVIDWADTLFAVKSEGSKITTDDSGNIYATGDIWLTDTTDYCVTVKLNSSGNVIWADTLDSSMTSNGLAIALDDSGDIYVSGYAYRDTVKNYLLMKYHKISSSSYSLSYAKIGNDTTDNYSNALTFNAYGNIFMLHNFEADTSYYIKAINPSGGGEYSSSPAFYKEIGNDLAIDSSGGLLVTGLYYGSYKDIFTIKRDTLLSATGAIQWHITTIHGDRE